jgi:Protein of unknown function (DUF1064)
MASFGWNNVSEADIARMNRSKTGAKPTSPQTRPALPVAKRAKYGNERKEVLGLVFASKKEADRYVYLRSLSEMGAIQLLTVQTRWEIYIDRPDGRRHVAYWLADFDYWIPPTDGRPAEHVIEDTKGGRATKTPVYLLKKKLVEAIHGIHIREV